MKADPLRLKEDAVEQRDLPPLGFDLDRLGGAPRAGVQRGQSSLNDLIEPGGAVRGGGGNEGEEQQHKDQLAKQKRQHELKVRVREIDGIEPFFVW